MASMPSGSTQIARTLPWNQKWERQQWGDSLFAPNLSPTPDNCCLFLFQRLVLRVLKSMAHKDGTGRLRVDFEFLSLVQNPLATLTQQGHKTQHEDA